MSVVRLTATAADIGGDFTVVIEHRSADGRQFRVRAVTSTVLTEQDRQDLHWYLEEYLLQTYPPHEHRAARIEQRMRELGEGLFRDLFQANDDARDLWATLRQDLPATRVEIEADIAAGTAIPWELIRDPRLTTPLALEAAAFVRVQSQTAVRAPLPKLKAGDKLRVLVAICRPDGGDDVPFRSVASRILKSVSAADRQRIDLTVLRPPTFERLGEELRRAKNAGEPYHILHFDGHGMYEDLQEAEKGGGGGFSRLWMGKFARPGKHGYLCFEDDGTDGNFRPVSGEELGNLLRQTGVPVLLLNACRSAHSDARPQDGADGPQGQQVRAFGSLAQEVVNAGVAGVLAMRYNLWVVTAQQYVEALYRNLAGCKSLGAAATDARRNLFEQPGRRIAGEGVDLQDWVVPAVFEADTVTLLPAVRKRKKGETAATLSFDGGDSTAWPGSDGQLPLPPDIGFIGRDETVLALDRGFDKHRVLLLHAYAGAGKTSTAAEFARWYRDTNGLGEGGIVLFDSFERYGYDVTLPGLLAKLGRQFEKELRQGGVEWQALDDGQQRQVALDLLSQVPILWIWDSIELVTRFSAGVSSNWSAEEQQELRDFLRTVATRQGRGKILLTSRHDEAGWLGQIPARVTAPPLRPADRLAMAEKLAERHGRRMGLSWVLKPLLDYSQGNPRILTMMIGKALLDGLSTPEQVEAYIAKLRSGEIELTEKLIKGEENLANPVTQPEIKPLRPRFFIRLPSGTAGDFNPSALRAQTVDQFQHILTFGPFAEAASVISGEGEASVGVMLSDETLLVDNPQIAEFLKSQGAKIYQDVQFQIFDEPAIPQIPRLRYWEAASTMVLHRASGSLDNVIDQIKARDAWALTQGERATIVVIDTGIHSDLLEIGDNRRSRLNPKTFHADRHWIDDGGHGSMCAAIAAGGGPNARFQGVAPLAKVVSCRTDFSASDISSLYLHLVQAKQSGELAGPLVVNNSYGLYTCQSSNLLPQDHPFFDSIEAALAAGITVVFSAGNNHHDLVCHYDPAADHPNTIWGPASHDRVLAVGTVNRAESNQDPATPHVNSSRGPGEWAASYPKPDCVAPTYGNVIWGNEIRNMDWWGTSGAAPQAAGLAALIQSYAEEALGGAFQPADVNDIIRRSCRRLEAPENCVGSGIIDCHAALIEARKRREG